MKKRSFSPERLYILVRNIIIFISGIIFIASAVTYYMARSAQSKLRDIDKNIEYPKKYKDKSFLDVDDFLYFIDGTYDTNDKCYDYLFLKSLPDETTPTKEQLLEREECEKEIAIRQELIKLFKLPNGFNNIEDIEKYRAKLKEYNRLSGVPLSLFVFAIGIQVIFWLIILLYRYLFPVVDMKK